MGDDLGFGGIEGVGEALRAQGYIADRPLASALFLALRLRKPLLLEGEPGCGKTDVGRALAAALHAPLIRLQCYEGLDATSTLYEWNYPKQLLTIRLYEHTRDPRELEKEIFGEAFLLKRPLLQALTYEGPGPALLLVDEVDRVDEEFEGLLLEFLSDFQVTVPEVGTIRARVPPVVLLTSNRTRELGDALKRRCLYQYMGYPTMDREVTILRSRVPAIGARLAQEVTAFVQRVRAEGDVLRKPGVAETLDWANGLLALGATDLDPPTVRDTLGFIAKEAEDIRTLEGRLDRLLGRAP